MEELDNITEFIKSPAFALMSDAVRTETLTKQQELGFAAIQKIIDEQIAPIINQNDLNLSVVIKDGKEAPVAVKKKKKEFSVETVEAEYPNYLGVIMKKDLDWSLFNHGFTVPKEFHFAVSHACSKDVIPGTNAKVYVLFKHTEYPAAVHNDKNGVMQFDFSKALTKAIQSLYPETYNYMVMEKAKAANKKAMIKLPDNLKHELIICSCKEEDQFILIERD